MKDTSMNQTLTNTQSNAIATFDDLPNSANVSRIVVEKLFGCSRATLWRWVKKGTIPYPRKFSQGATRWNVGELRIALGDQK